MPGSKGQGFRFGWWELVDGGKKWRCGFVDRSDRLLWFGGRESELGFCLVGGLIWEGDECWDIGRG